MSKPYSQMTPEERLRDRIAKNRRIDQRAGFTLDGIVDQLSSHRRRATYAAVAQLLGVIPRNLMANRPRSRRDSWVVAGSSDGDSRRGWPTGYGDSQIDPECIRQISAGDDNILETPMQLLEWLRSLK